MSNLGFQWVYRLFNRIPDFVCERFFFEEGEPAATFETGTPLSEFGLLAWSLSWEMDIVNILRTLAAAGIPTRREDRDERHPILLVGGDIARMNPAALAPFVDVFAMGDGERLVPRIAELVAVAASTATGSSRRRPGCRASSCPAVHGPRAEAAENGSVVVQQPMSRKEITPDFEVPHTTILTPRTELADKLLIEISRGCTEMCRFCWAAYAMAPVKQYPAASILEGRARGAAADRPDGPDRDGRLRPPGDRARSWRGSPSSGTTSRFPPSRSTRSRTRSSRSSPARASARSSIAPEAGNERLRRHINKKVSDAMLDEKARLVFARGFTRLKLYLQVGLPSETEEDVRDIVRLVERLHAIAVEEGRRRGRVAELVPSVNAFIPKPHTPYEDESLAEEELLQERLGFLQREFARMPNVVFRGMPVGEAVWEAFLAKVDESGADILEEAASGVPVRRLLKTHRDRIAAVVRPQAVSARRRRRRRPGRSFRSVESNLDSERRRLVKLAIACARSWSLAAARRGARPRLSAR